MIRIFLGFLLAISLVMPDAAAQSAVFSKGINLSSWLANADRQEVNDADLEQIKNAGFDHVRLPVNPENFQILVNDDRFLKPGPYFKPVDEAIKRIIRHGFVVILDIHPYEEYRNQIEESGRAAENFVKIWGHLAEHFKDVPASKLVFEILNEPQYYRAEDSYNTLARKAVEAIRRVDQSRTIIIGAPQGSSIEGIDQMRVIKDPNIVYSFHFYEPYMVTHQGIHMGFENLMLRHFRNVPYPANRAYKDIKTYASRAPNREQAAQELQQYRDENWNTTKIAERIRLAGDWARKNGVKLHCGEFGVLRNHIDPESRYQWIKDARVALEQNNIAWSLWDYSDIFGIVRFEGADIYTDPVDGAVRFAQANSRGTRVIEPAAREALGLRSAGASAAAAPSVIVTPAAASSNAAEDIDSQEKTFQQEDVTAPTAEDVPDESRQETGDIDDPQTAQQKWRRHWHGQRMNDRNARRSQDAR